MNAIKRQKIAIIGTGIAGLGAATLLRNHHDITVFEKNHYIGGHGRTIDVTIDGKLIAVDTGFIVFNQRNYPLLTRLFRHINLPIVKSNMSFGVTINQGWLEYGTPKLRNLFAQKRNLLRPNYWRMLLDILKFNRQVRHSIRQNPNQSLGQCLADLKLGQWFQDYFILAMGGAIWSTPPSEMLNFPAATFVRFFENHGLLTINDQPQWYTVTGGSRNYINRLAAQFRPAIHLNRAVIRVVRQDDFVVIIDENGQKSQFDLVVFACHSDQALAMIDQPTPQELAILSALRFQPNRVVLHGDISFMPKRRQAWSSWVYLSQGDKKQISLTYWMNNLQKLATHHPIFVTLNPGREPDAKMIYDEFVFEHPVMDAAAITAQSQIDSIQGIDRFWFCGAYLRHGFHEDGLDSAVKMAKQMGIDPPW